jgi:hypothetical protein
MPSAGRMKKFIFRRFFGTSERSFHYEMDKKSVLSQCAFWRKFEKGHQHDDPKRILIIFAVVFFGENPEFDHGLKGSSFIGQPNPNLRRLRNRSKRPKFRIRPSSAPINA